jgi:hypothetical protein
MEGWRAEVKTPEKIDARQVELNFDRNNNRIRGNEK